MPQKNDESQVILALQAMQNDKKLSARAAGKIYHVDHEKLSRRRRGMQSRCNMSANSRRLTDLEESTIVEHILDLDSKGFPPRLSGVEDMANRLLATRDAGCVGKWYKRYLEEVASGQLELPAYKRNGDGSVKIQYGEVFCRVPDCSKAQKRYCYVGV